MEKLIAKYLNKLEAQGLASKADAVFLALDAEVISNKPIQGDILGLSRVFDFMSINSLLFAQPAEPYKGIIDEIIRYDSHYQAQGKIVPMDCETRTFFHDIPIVGEFLPEVIAEALSRRKSVIVKDRGIVTYGVVTPEQAFVSFSSTCFSTFVKYFFDILTHLEDCCSGKALPDNDRIRGFQEIVRRYRMVAPDQSAASLSPGPPGDEDAIISMLAEAGRAVVEHRLVDSYFGNISYTHGSTIYISQTGSSMDELESCIDAVPLDGSSSGGITASSELSAHKNVYLQTGQTAILHGHPRFPVLLSLHCPGKDCDRGLCHSACREKRDIAGIPVVSGEIGTGPAGLMHTVPPAMQENRGVIVYGHGVFTSGRNDFQKPFSRLLDIDKTCRAEYFRRIGKYLEELKIDPEFLGE